jgi:hypothetical protein
MVNLTPGGLGLIEVGSYGALLAMGVPEPKIMVLLSARESSPPFHDRSGTDDSPYFLAGTRLREGKQSEFSIPNWRRSSRSDQEWNHA